MPKLGVHCTAIMESRHIDVLEMDAASHTGIDDVRQITDGVRYAPSSARYKVYIIDEVHMLSDKAFNAFLKTLEEPPPHAKFIFATTEIRKVPITVLSRCQRFDLRRVDAEVLVKHLGNIAAHESIGAEPEALSLIARAAEGSVRDSLSLFDQAIAHAAGLVRAEDVRQMLGLADRARVIDLFDAVARGDIEAAFREFRDQYDTGADPVVVLSDLAEFVNFVTRVKIVPATADQAAFTETERRRGREFAARLSVKALSRFWQMLLKGITEVQAATRPVAAAEMVLVRLAYVADLPTPDELIRTLSGDAATASSAGPAGGRGASGPAPRGENAASAPRVSTGPAVHSLRDPAPRPPMPHTPPVAAWEEEPARTLANFAALVALAAEQRDLPIKTALERDVRLVRFEDGRLEINLEPSAPRTLVHDLQRKLGQWTGRRWVVVVSTQPGAPTLREQAEDAQAALRRGAADDARVRAVLARFPGAQVAAVRRGVDRDASGDDADFDSETDSDD
jgi:DNA polymerase-3 subunit gamma/tau